MEVARGARQAFMEEQVVLGASKGQGGAGKKILRDRQADLNMTGFSRGPAISAFTRNSQWAWFFWFSCFGPGRPAGFAVVLAGLFR